MATIAEQIVIEKSAVLTFENEVKNVKKEITEFCLK